MSFVYQPATGNMAITEDQVAARVISGINADQAQDLCPMGPGGIIATHQFDLSEMDGFEAQVDVRGGEIIHPKFGLGPTYVRHGRIGPPIAPLAFGEHHIPVAKVALL